MSTPIQQQHTHRQVAVDSASVDTRNAVQDKTVDLDVLYRLLKNGRWRILQMGLAASILAALFAFLLPSTYTSTASLVPPSASGSSSAAALMGQLSALGAGSLMGAGKSSGDLYVGMLKSRFVAQYMIKRFNLRDVYRVAKESKAEKQLAAHSEFLVGTKDSIISIAVSDHSPERARDLANGYLDALSLLTANIALTESSQRRLFYEQRLAREKDDLSSAEVSLRQSQEASGLISPAGQTTAEIQTIAQLRAQVGGREVQLASLLQDETEQNPDIIRLRREISDLQGQIARMESGSGHGVGNIPTAQVPALQLDYIRKAREVKYHEALFEIIAKQYEAARLDEAHDAPLQVLDRPAVADSPSGPPRLTLIFGGLLFGTVAGAAWVLFAAWRSEIALQGNVL